MYALATTNKILDVYGQNGTSGYDISCSFSKTVAASSIATKAKFQGHNFAVNSFHGHLLYHPVYRLRLGIEDLETCERVFSASNAVASVICHASYFHWLQFIDLHFDQWNQDKYLELSRFLYNNYKQVLHYINDYTPMVEELKTQLQIQDTDFERWNVEELEYLNSLSVESEDKVQNAVYVEALESLAHAE
ncbi:hypothetical protein HYDPIDRAFT_177248 [Hydnomerulius pinastri MD-312]|uniref:Uncharacterized protein n=1 Tax=Hydnomerulius pinastri MD-312 TaxID=994086 RepID=A0A0C9VSU3_9AGAM|nr:hypothetical protein HYDPIDRAFT_177248 [Hydnomerulius pinastri MD-312]